MTGWFDGFQTHRLPGVDGVHIHLRHGGRRDAPPLLLVHGFPQTHAMWHRVAQALAQDFELVLPDLRGYGDSDKPAGLPDHANYSKRVMAADLVAVMQALGHERFAVCGHDRGARVAHRMALDHPHRVTRLGIVDICPTLAMYEATDLAFAHAYYHWFFLVQPPPVPETLIGPNTGFYLHHILESWSAGPADYFEPQAVAEYERWYASPASVHASCEDYRASAGIDLAHDRSSRDQGQKVACDLLALWGERGVVNRQFDPLALWQAACGGRVSGHALPAGHFVPEERPAQVAASLREFLLAEPQDASY